MTKFGVAALALALWAMPSFAQQADDMKSWTEACKDWDEWDKPGPPFQIFGEDTWYVGTCGITSILITTRDGHILIDSGTEQGADIVLQNVRTLGFQPSDIRYLLTSHEHFDHVGGIAKIQRATGAKLITSKAAAKVFESGKASPDDPQFGLSEGVAPARVDRVVANGDIVELAHVKIVAIETPGHTPGALSWQWDSLQGWDNYSNVVYADSLSPISNDEYRFSDHPAYLESYRAGIDRLAEIDRCLLVTPHPSASDMRSRLQGNRLTIGGRHDCRDYAEGIRKRLDARLAEEAASAQ